MIEIYTRLYREEQEIRRAMGQEPDRCGPALALAIGVGTLAAGLAAIGCVVGFIAAVMS